MTDRVPAVYLIRHADAGDPAAFSGDDDVRPLSGKGIGQAERLGVHLALAGFRPDVILSSPKLRALQTAEIVAAALAGAVTVDERLGGGVGLPELEAILRDVGGEAGLPRKTVLVGHDPDFSELLATLTGAHSVSMKKGALARIDLPDGVSPGTGVLRWLVPPDLLPKDGRASG